MEYIYIIIERANKENSLDRILNTAFSTKIRVLEEIRKLNKKNIKYQVLKLKLDTKEF